MILEHNNYNLANQAFIDIVNSLMFSFICELYATSQINVKGRSRRKKIVPHYYSSRSILIRPLFVDLIESVVSCFIVKFDPY